MVFARAPLSRSLPSNEFLRKSNDIDLFLRTLLLREGTSILPRFDKELVPACIEHAPVLAAFCESRGSLQTLVPTSGLRPRLLARCCEAKLPQSLSFARGCSNSVSTWTLTPTL